MTLIYTYPFDLRAELALLVASGAAFYFLFQQKKSKHKYPLLAFSVLLFVFSVSSLYRGWGISQALKNECRGSGCTVIEGEVRDFRSHQGSKKFRTNEFSIDGRRFTIYGSSSDPRGFDGYGLIVEKGGAITPGSHVKLYVYDGKIIQLYKDEP
ncbi:hypothetical protein ABF162_24985 (plasmid) [Vibrio coralliilyticus]|uniref:hypothetical protein n=1 Tax=Vibrio coralliilyticus TaxID=190893 RepID=UPI0005127EFF|nr:hypothetical protein [Vibrio coralliilyticus]AIS58281.1 hypothetical protein JV59_24925 [Vibrio coralliilyticus]